MPVRSQWLCALIIILLLPVAYAGTLYRWVDAYGVVHISDQKPPPDNANSGIQAYPYPENKVETRQNGTGVQGTESQVLQNNRDSGQLKTARMEYEAAQKKAKEALVKAEQLQLEADQYVQKWGAVSRTRRGVRVKTALKQEAAEEAAREAKHFSELASEAEARMKNLEKE